jgi:hypothetical protein
MNSGLRTSILLFLLVVTAAASANAYDASWYKGVGWSGEYPYGFTTTKDVTIQIRETLDPTAPTTISCDLKKGATYHQWNDDRVKSDGLEFISFTKIETYQVKSDFKDEVNPESEDRSIVMNFKKGDRWFFLKYFGEGAFLFKFNNKVYINGGGLFGQSTKISPNGDQHSRSDENYNEWLKLKCANGVVGWIFVKDIKDAPGFSEANVMDYGKASDVSESTPKPTVLASPAPIKMPPTFEFRGHRIGEPVEKNFPYWAKGFRSLDLPYCSKHDGGIVSCADSAKTVGDVYIGSLLYFFFDQKLYSIGMSFAANAHAKVRTMLIGKYGFPNAERNDPVQNTMGAVFDNLVSEWNFAEGTLVLKMRSGKVDTSFLTFNNPLIERAAGLRTILKQQEQGKRAF